MAQSSEDQALPAMSNNGSISILWRLVTPEASELTVSKLTWLVVGGDPAARSHKVEQFTAL